MNERVKHKFLVTGQLPLNVKDTQQEILDQMPEGRKVYLSKIADLLDPHNNIYKTYLEKERMFLDSMKKEPDPVCYQRYTQPKRRGTNGETI